MKKEKVSKADFEIHDKDHRSKAILSVLVQKFTELPGKKVSDTVNQIFFAKNLRIKMDRELKEKDIRITSDTRRPVDPGQRRLFNKSIPALIGLLQGQHIHEQEK